MSPLTATQNVAYRGPGQYVPDAQVRDIVANVIQAWIINDADELTASIHGILEQHIPYLRPSEGLTHHIQQLIDQICHSILSDAAADRSASNGDG